MAHFSEDTINRGRHNGSRSRSEVESSHFALLHASILHSEEKLDANLPLGRKFLRFSKLKSKFFKNFNEERVNIYTREFVIKSCK